MTKGVSFLFQIAYNIFITIKFLNNMPVEFHTVNSGALDYRNLIEDESIGIDSLINRFLVMGDCALGILHESIHENHGISANRDRVINKVFPIVEDIIKARVLRRQIEAKTKSDVLAAVKTGKITTEEAIKLMEAFDLAEKSPELNAQDIPSLPAINVVLKNEPRLVEERPNAED